MGAWAGRDAPALHKHVRHVGGRDVTDVEGKNARPERRLVRREGFPITVDGHAFDITHALIQTPRHGYLVLAHRLDASVGIKELEARHETS